MEAFPLFNSTELSFRSWCNVLTRAEEAISQSCRRANALLTFADAKVEGISSAYQLRLSLNLALYRTFWTGPMALGSSGPGKVERGRVEEINGAARKYSN